jgi:Fur family transcriptional regulator, ferric uptake regulator
VIELLDAEPCALSAIEIEEALRHREGAARTASRASIYRVLDELTELGLVARLEVGQGVIRFEAVREGHGHHHHLICDRCGTVTPFRDEELERTIHHVSRRVALRVKEHEIILHGSCDDCDS